MKKIIKYALFTAILIAMFLSNNMYAQTLSWAKTWNSGAYDNDEAHAVVVDASGNVYTTGKSQTATGTQLETIKYNSSGTQIWAISTSSSYGWQNGIDIAVDPAGYYVWVAGSTSDVNGHSHLTLIKYKVSNGSIPSGFPKIYNDNPGNNWARGTCLAVYDTSNVYIGGSTNDGTNWNLIVLKNNPSGTGWSWTYTNTNYQSATQAEATDLKINASNTALYVTGNYFRGAGYGEDILTAKLNPSTGGESWISRYDGAGYDDFGNAIAFDGDGYVYVAGYSHLTSGSNKEDALLLRYHGSGTYQYAQTYNGSSYNDWWSDITVGPKLVFGYVIFVGGTTTLGLAESHDENYLLGAYYSTNGNSYWGTNPVTYDGVKTPPEATGTDEGWAISYEPSTSRIYISGRSDETNSIVNITTRGYQVSDGTNVFSTSYDYNNTTQQLADQIYSKYTLKTKYGTCSTDQIYVAGDKAVANNGYDYLTLKYGYNGQPCDGPIDGRLANLSNETQTDFYPNPFYSEAVLSINNDNLVSNASLYIYDMTGKVMRYQNNINTNTIIIKREDLTPGIYFYKLSDDRHILSSGKFMIVD